MARRRRRTIQYQVVVAVLHFDGRPGSDVTLDARCGFCRRRPRAGLPAIHGDPGSGAVRLRADGGRDGRALSTLGQEIATEIRALPRDDEEADADILVLAAARAASSWRVTWRERSTDRRGGAPRDRRLLSQHQLLASKNEIGSAKVASRATEASRAVGA